jgi:hypothetical protein
MIKKTFSGVFGAFRSATFFARSIGENNAEKLHAKI